LTSVVIPNSVTSIGQLAFWNNALTSITIESGVNIAGVSGGQHAMGTHGAAFLTLYNSNGRLAGTYTWDGIRWTRQP